MRGGPRSGRPIQYVHIMNHDKNCGSFSPFLGFSIPLTLYLMLVHQTMTPMRTEARNDNNTSPGESHR